MIKNLVLFLMLFFGVLCSVKAQVVQSFANVFVGTTVPTVCRTPTIFISSVSGIVYTCQSNVFVPVGVGGGGVITPSQLPSFLTGSTGADFNIDVNVADVTFNLPTAQCAIRGVIDGTPQVFCGNKTFLGDTLIDGALYVTGLFSTDHPIEITGEACGTSEANVGLFGFDPVTGQPCYSYDGSTPGPLPFPRLDQVLDPTADKAFAMGGKQLILTGADLYFFDMTRVVGPLTYYSFASFDPTIQEFRIEASGADSPNIVALLGSARDATSGTSSLSIGIEGEALSTNSVGGALSITAGVQGKVQHQGTGTIGTAYSLWADSTANTGGGTITNNYGLFIGDQTAGSANYAIKTIGAARLDFGGVINAPRFKSSGTALVAGDFAVHANWGNGPATIGTITGTDQAFDYTITATGAAQGVNPTVILTYKDGTWTDAPLFNCNMNGGTGALSFITTSSSATALTMTYIGTPVTTLTYRMSCVGMGR